MIIKEPRLIKTNTEEQFAAWLTTQKNANGKKYKQIVAKGYARNLRTEPPKLDISLSLDERDVFRCRTTAEFDTLNSAFQAAPNFREVNRGANHGAFSAGLAAYRRYLHFIESNGKPEMNIIKDGSARFAQQTVRDAFRKWLAIHNPEWSSGTVAMHYSDAYYLYKNNHGITLEDALTADEGLQRAYDVIERFYMDNPTQTNNPSGSARGYLRSLRMLKEFLDEQYPDLLSANSSSTLAPTVPNAVIDVLNNNYASGFRFDATYINLLSSASGVEVDEHMQSALKRIMFRRDDGIYFLLDIVANAATRKDIIDFADTYLQEYGCFEIPEFYKLYEDKVNLNCIRNADDFESFYEQIGKSGVRCVQAPNVGNRIARYSNGNVWSTFKEVAAKIIFVITEEYYGSCNEDDLHAKFRAFSTDLLGKIIKQCAADELIRVEINDSVCYQTFDALGLPENFSEVLAESLERLSDIGLDLTQDALHTTLSLKLGVNFRAEYNLPDWDSFRRLIASFYKTKPRREWKSNIFGEVTN